MDDIFWVSDGTSAGTIVIPPAIYTPPTAVDYLTVMNNAIYFQASYNSSVGSELYKLTDGSTSVQELSSNTFTVFPNPAYGNVTVSNNQPFNDKCMLVIEDLTGHKVAEYKMSPGSNSYTFSSGEFANGVYTCKLVSGNEIAAQRLVVVK